MNKKQNSNFKLILKPTLILGLICFAIALLLALVNYMTEEPIRAQELARENEAKRLVMPQADSFESAEFAATSDMDAFTYDQAFDADHQLIGYVFKNSSQGYGGPVTVNVGIDPEGRITGVKPLDLSETPNIGMRVAEPAFAEQFIGKTYGVSSTKGVPGENEIQAVSGATYSTGAFMDSVSQAFEQFNLIREAVNE